MTEGRRLKFKEEIVSTVSNPISTRELLTRLAELHQELSILEQSQVDLASLSVVKEQLVNKKLLKNTNRGVQALVCCCLTDVLRLFAPDAPYSSSTLASIFRLFLQQFPFLDDQDSVYYPHYVYMLERIAEVKLIALMTDLDHNEKLIVRLFETFYALTSNESFDKEKLQPALISILNEVISEANQLDLRVLKLILNKFLANSKNMKNQSNIRVPGFDLSLALCEINSDKLSRLVTYFFSEMILEATKNDDAYDMDYSESDDSEDNKNNSRDGQGPMIDMVQMKKIHTLAVELWRYVPEMLTSVLGLLDNELEADDPLVRSIATDTISKMLAMQPSRINFPATFASTYLNWLKKPFDISISLRRTWINGSAEILEARNDITSDIVNGLLKTLVDSNDKVRLQTIVELKKLKPSTFLDKVMKDSLMDTLFKLIREKHHTIRTEIINFLSTIYNYATKEETHRSHRMIQDIPNHILNLIYINDNTINAEVDIALCEKILPFSSNTEARVNRLLFTLSVLNDKARQSFLAILRRQPQVSKVILQLIAIIEDEEDEHKDQKIGNAVKWLSKGFPPTYNPQESLQSFISLDNKRFFRLLRVISTPSSDYDTIVNGMKEILNRLRDGKLFDQNKLFESVKTGEIYNTIQLLMLRSSNVFLNVDNITELIEINNDSTHQFNQAAKLLLTNISIIYPENLSSSIKGIVDRLVEKARNIDFCGIRIHSDCWKDLKIIHKFLENGDRVCGNREFYDTLFEFSIKGTVLEAKYSVKIMNKMEEEIKGVYFVKMVHHVWPLNIGSSFFNTHLSALCSLFLCDLISVDHIKEELSEFLASEVLLKNRLKEEENEEAKLSTWISDEDLNYSIENTNCYSKILAMKLLTNWLISISDYPTAEVEQIAKPILSMLSSFINRGGEIVSTNDTPPRFASRLRVHAGIELTKLSQYPSYETLIDQRRINRLILLVQDVEMNVRKLFLEKLKKKIIQNRVSKKFLPLIFFTAFEPEKSLKLTTTTWITALFTKRASSSNTEALIFEKSYIRLLHMLGNHPEFKELFGSYTEVDDSQEGTKHDAFKEMSMFAITHIVYALSLISTFDNISLLYYLSQRIKQFEAISTIEGEHSDTAIYFISDLSQAALKYIGKVKNWNISIWPNQLSLPSDLFSKLSNDKANENVKTNFIPDKYASAIDELIRLRWRAEHTPAKSRKNKKKHSQLEVQALEDGEDNTGKRNFTKKRKNSDDGGIRSLKEGDQDYVEKSTKGSKYEGVRRSKRSRRVDYNEETY